MTTTTTAQHPKANAVLWIRRFTPACVYLLGATFGGVATVLLFAVNLETDSGLPWALLLATVLLYWLAWGLLERNARSWKLLHALGAVATGATGLSILVLHTLGASEWIRFGGGAFAQQTALLWVCGLILIAWSVAIMRNQSFASVSWQAAMLPVLITVAVWLVRLIDQASFIDVQHFQVVIILWFAGSLIVFAVLNRRATLMAATQRAKARAVKARRAPVDIPRSFPTKQHELLARGRFCELLEMPCTTPCPLTVAVASKYQQQRIKYNLYPEVLEPLEKAYTILITPQLRELCRTTHEIMTQKERQLGPKRYQEYEVLLWTKLWARVQDGEFKSDATKVARERVRLLKELTIDDE